MEGYLDLYNQVCWDDETLKHLFWSGMDDILGQMLLLGEGHRPFAKYVDYTLWVCRFSLTVRVIEEKDIISDTRHLHSSFQPVMSWEA